MVKGKKQEEEQKSQKNPNENLENCVEKPNDVIFVNKYVQQGNL